LEYCRKRALRSSRAAVTLMLLESYLYTGLRAIELLGLTLHDIPPWNGHKNILRVSAEFAKGGKQRTIQVSEKIVAKWEAFVARFHQPALLQMASTNADKRLRGYKTPLFLNEAGKPMEYHSVWQRFKRLGENCGFDLRPHIFRHTYATELYRETKDLRYVQRQLGHSSPNVTAIYEHSISADSIKQLEYLDWDYSIPTVNFPATADTPVVSPDSADVCGHADEAAQKRQ
jgi:site-specific recombinase XerD